MQGLGGITLCGLKAAVYLPHRKSSTHISDGDSSTPPLLTVLLNVHVLGLLLLAAVQLG